MLIDHITLNLKAGNGGDGVVRWRREKGIPYGGPAGGDGGKGGDVYFHIVRDIHALSKYKHKKEWEADNGEHGQKRSMHGKNANDLILDIPLGSRVYNRTYDISYEFLIEGEKILILKGGKGGLGNENFKSSTNRTPKEFTKGTRGEDAVFDIELDLIADIGFIGLPNAGKSSLLNNLTNAGAKVADYAFTTLEPNLGAYNGLVLADIPGLIEGASEGKGLGHKFLKHIRRTGMLAHLVSVKNDDVIKAYKTIRNELNLFDTELNNKYEIIFISHSDEADNGTLNKIREELEKVKSDNTLAIEFLSNYDDVSVKRAGDLIYNTIQLHREKYIATPIDKRTPEDYEEDIMLSELD